MRDISKKIEEIGKRLVHSTIRMSPEMEIMANSQSIAMNISAFTNVDYEIILKEHQCVGLAATNRKLNRLYEYIMEGGEYSDFGKDKQYGLCPSCGNEYIDFNGTCCACLFGDIANVFSDFGEAIKPIVDALAKLSNTPTEKELAKQRSRDDLKSKRRQLRRGVDIHGG